MESIWTWLKGKKRNIGLILFAVNAWANIQWDIPPHTQMLVLAILGAVGFVGAVDGIKKVK